MASSSAATVAEFWGVDGNGTVEVWAVWIAPEWRRLALPALLCGAGAAHAT